MALNMRQRKFCELYCGECARNVRESAMKAGYSVHYANSRIRGLLKNKEIQEYIKELTAETNAQTVAQIVDIKKFWTDIMNSNSYRTQDRLKASELLAKTMGMFDKEW